MTYIPEGATHTNSGQDLYYKCIDGVWFAHGQCKQDNWFESLSYNRDKYGELEIDPSELISLKSEEKTITTNEKNIEAGDFVKININPYGSKDFIIGNYYEVLKVSNPNCIGLIDGSGDDEEGNGWSFSRGWIDDVCKGGIMTQQWQEMTQEEVMNVQVGDKIRIDGVETVVTRLYDRAFGDYGFDVCDENPASFKWTGGENIVPSTTVKGMNNIFEKPITQSAHTIPSLANKKIWVKDLTEDQKKRIQDVAFEQGFGWFACQKDYYALDADAYFIGMRDNTNITCIDDDDKEYFNNDGNEEITYEEIFGESPERVIEVGDYVRVIASEEALEVVGNEYNESGEIYKVVKKAGQNSTFALGGDPDEDACWVGGDYIELCAKPDNNPIASEQTMNNLREICSKAHVQVLVRAGYFTIYSEEDEREIVCNSEEELFDILDQLVTIQEMSEKIGWTI